MSAIEPTEEQQKFAEAWTLGRAIIDRADVERLTKTLSTLSQEQPRASEGETLNVDLWYPSDDKPSHVVIELMHVRAAEDLRVSFSLARNGYVVELSGWDSVNGATTWREVAFVDGSIDDDEGGDP